MQNFTWEASEKKLARRVFNTALQNELAEIMASYKARAAEAKEPDDLWAMESYLRQTRNELDKKYDFRYSQLCRVFGCLLREKRITELQLAGLADDKLAAIRRIGSF